MKLRSLSGSCACNTSAGLSKLWPARSNSTVPPCSICCKTFRRVALDPSFPSGSCYVHTVDQDNTAWKHGWQFWCMIIIIKMMMVILMMVMMMMMMMWRWRWWYPVQMNDIRIYKWSGFKKWKRNLIIVWPEALQYDKYTVFSIHRNGLSHDFLDQESLSPPTPPVTNHLQTRRPRPCGCCPWGTTGQRQKGCCLRVVGFQTYYSTLKI